MKNLLLTGTLFGCIALMTSCGGNVNSLLGGAKYPADQADSYAKAVEVLKEKVDTTKFKIFAIRFNEKEELSNELSSMSLDMVNADNYAFRQAYYMDGRVGQMNDYSTSVNEVDFAKSRESAFRRSIRQLSDVRSKRPNKSFPKVILSNQSVCIRSTKCFLNNHLY